LSVIFSQQITLPEALNYFIICVQKNGNQVFRIDEIWNIDIRNPNNNWVSCELIDLQNLSSETFDENYYTVNHI
jgi:hypothetical protein